MQPVLQRIEQVMGARRASRGGLIQTLWSGYGELFRVYLDGAELGGQPVDSVIVKHVRPPRAAKRDRGHQRKLRSYQVELAWYRDWSGRCGPDCRVPHFIAGDETLGEWFFVLEDLDSAGFDQRRRSLSRVEIEAVLRWLATFHGTFMGQTPTGLWPVGTYWHLATRPDELAATRDPTLRRAAAAIDARLSGARFQTLVHGDAKVANFCFGTGGVAAVDFQYVGGGCGMKDVAYFLSSVLGDRALDQQVPHLLDHYFVCLREAVGPDVDADALETEWRGLHPWAWADFVRFMAGWAPGHWRRERYALTMTEQVLGEP